MRDDESERKKSSVDSVGGCFAVFINLSLLLIVGGGAISSLREDVRSRTGWTLAGLSIVFIVPLVIRKKPNPGDPDQVEHRRKSARALQALGWIHSGFQPSRAPDDIPPRPTDQPVRLKE